MLVMETQRLRLRQLSFDDVAFILRLLNEPSFIEHIGDRGIRTLDDAKTYLVHGPIASHDELGFGLDCVELKESGQPIGICGLLKRPVLDDVDVGYAFLPEYWSRGYAREAVSAVVANARKSFDLRRIAAVVNEDNEGSIRLLEKIGFRYERMVKLYEAEPEICLYVSES